MSWLMLSASGTKHFVQCDYSAMFKTRGVSTVVEWKRIQRMLTRDNISYLYLQTTHVYLLIYETGWKFLKVLDSIFMSITVDTSNL